MGLLGFWVRWDGVDCDDVVVDGTACEDSVSKVRYPSRWRDDARRLGMLGFRRDQHIGSTRMWIKKLYIQSCQKQRLLKASRAQLRAPQYPNTLTTI